jgi:hypothetical protein
MPSIRLPLPLRHHHHMHEPNRYATCIVYRTVMTMMPVRLLEKHKVFLVRVRRGESRPYSRCAFLENTDIGIRGSACCSASRQL